ncbi:APC family permease [Aquimarina hainanensis]|uniref:APC family permease n=1 Tax=Aquimarina hainanensis TaxID=1578017 RepID=A0ABW5NAG3_9FLAO|nr:APC family permease [Aquimarina sp. TRL1]QKX05452.1 APC family permease [Aquimarina sp. TRL1]
MSTSNKKVGTPTGIASILGLMLLASSLLTITQGISLGGYVFFIALVISYVLMMCQATSFAELSGIIPTVGAVYDYITIAMGRFWGVTATLASYVIVTFFASSAEVAAAGLFAQSNFPIVSSFVSPENSWIIGWGIVILCAIINIRGINMFALIENILSYSKYALMVILGIIGLFIIPKTNLDFIWGDSSIGHDISAIFTLVGFTLFLFVGAEYVTPLAPEMKDPNKNIKHSLFIGLTMSLIAMLIFGTSIVRLVPNEVVDQTSNTLLLETPESALVYGDAILGEVGKWGFVLVIFLATVALINTIIASIPRILYGMALDGVLPKIFLKTHKKYDTPYVGIIFIALIPMLGSYLIGSDINGVFALILAAICSWIFFYILINIAVVLLRKRHPKIVRPFKTPLYPLPQLLAIIGLFITFFYLVPPFLTPSQIYIPFFVILSICATYSFVWLKYKQEVPLWTPLEIEHVLQKHPHQETS